MTTKHAGDAIVSVPAVPIRELPACCIAAHKRGQKVVTYMCDNCKSMRQFDVDRPQQFCKQPVVCSCGHQQLVYLF